VSIRKVGIERAHRRRRTGRDGSGTGDSFARDRTSAGAGTAGAHIWREAQGLVVGLQSRPDDLRRPSGAHADERQPGIRNKHTAKRRELNDEVLLPPTDGQGTAERMMRAIGRAAGVPYSDSDPPRTRYRRPSASSRSVATALSQPTPRNFAMMSVMTATVTPPARWTDPVRAFSDQRRRPAVCASPGRGRCHLLGWPAQAQKFPPWQGRPYGARALGTTSRRE
jgi:hypothetical protein